MNFTPAIARSTASARLQEDLRERMVFLGGPRQVGKTTLSTSLRPKHETTYLNWDIDEDRTAILRKELGETPLLVLDELHKYRPWRGYLKGLWDGMKAGKTPRREILVTGSARLDVYRHGGDSLQGRYHFLRLLPLSYIEVGAQGPSTVEALMRYGGFPEPFLRQSDDFLRRWQREYGARLVRDDVRDLEAVQDLASIELLNERLPACVGSPLSVNGLREQLLKSHGTVAKWIEILERLYAVFRLAPLGAPRINAVKKEQKLYCMDWARIDDPAFRFENLVAVHLLKHVFWKQDTEGRDYDLRYFRDRDGREVDFVVTLKGAPTLLVECKRSDRPASNHLLYLLKKFPQARAFQVSLEGQKDFVTETGVRVCPAHRLLEELA